MNLRFSVLYRADGKPIEIAEFYRNIRGEYVFSYKDDAKYEFPGFDLSQKRYISQSLWEQISFRIPNNVRNRFPDSKPEELLKETKGRLVTDHFEFRPV